MKIKEFFKSCFIPLKYFLNCYEKYNISKDEYINIIIKLHIKKKKY